ncbi:MAG: HigA family addiction module antitoxin [Treponema sp.]|nr:HigA family addiction module antitoxin [Treponema sp.]
MPKSSNAQAPGEVLQSYIDSYQTNAFALSKSIKVAYQSVTNILKGKGRISVNIAMRLGKFFGNAVEYWLDVQSSYEIAVLFSDAKFSKVYKSIPKAVKPKGKPAAENKAAGKSAAKTTGKKKKAVKGKTFKKTKTRKAGKK